MTALSCEGGGLSASKHLPIVVNSFHLKVAHEIYVAINCLNRNFLPLLDQVIHRSSLELVWILLKKEMYQLNHELPAMILPIKLKTLFNVEKKTLGKTKLYITWTTFQKYNTKTWDWQTLMGQITVLI